jgi:uncharacterized membrane protein
MDNVKPWWQSRAVIGGLVAFAAGVAGIFGIGVPESVQGSITDNVSAIVAAVAGLVAVYGRIKAQSRIK